LHNVNLISRIINRHQANQIYLSDILLEKSIKLVHGQVLKALGAEMLLLEQYPSAPTAERQKCPPREGKANHSSLRFETVFIRCFTAFSHPSTAVE